MPLPNLGLGSCGMASSLTGTGTVWNSETMSWELQYEPIVGIPVKINGHIHLATRFTSAFLNSGLYSGLFTGTHSSNIMYFPFVWLNLLVEIESGAADILAGILYGTPAMGGTLMLVFVILGVLLLLVGAGLCVKGKGAAVSPSK